MMVLHISHVVSNGGIVRQEKKKTAKLLLLPKTLKQLPVSRTIPMKFMNAVAADLFAVTLLLLLMARPSPRRLRSLLMTSNRYTPKLSRLRKIHPIWPLLLTPLLLSPLALLVQL